MNKKIEVLYEDNHFVAVNKAAGLLSQPNDGDTSESIADQVKEYIRKKYKKPGDVFLGTIHRLDRPVSGVLLFARTSKGLARMNELFKKREVDKTYWAIVKGIPGETEGQLTHFLLRNEKNKRTHAFNKQKNNALESVLDYKLLKVISKKSWLEVKPHTGRSHQIRAQLSAIGNPVVGDLKYDYNKANPDKSICLHARKLEFVHPIKKEKISITAPTPKLPIWLELKKDY
ncbi:MAG: RluA family pseudouridine synthase [Chitinophagales bacterium]